MKQGKETNWDSGMEIPHRVTFLDGNGDLPMIEVNTAASRAEIYLHGAHVTHFQKQNEEPMLFLSQVSRFKDDQPIRGGIPVILPWFGAREGGATHGFARLKSWMLKAITTQADGSIALRFILPESPEAAILPPFTADYTVAVGEALTLQLVIHNASEDVEFSLETCLHTYFSVSDISSVSIAGLQGVRYLDKCENFAPKTESAGEIRITRETDRVYLDTAGTVEIRDEKLRRRILIEKEGSASTVVWNPWIAKAQQMPDFGGDEYLRMVCVESGNVNANRLTLKPGESSKLTVKLSTQPL